MKRYSVILFFIFTFLLSWAPWYLAGNPKLLGWAPSVVGLVMVFAVGGKQGLRELLRRALHWRVGIGWWLIAILGQAAILLAAVSIYVLLGNPLPQYTVFAQEFWMLPIYFLLNLLFPLAGSLAEELGWRGFALPELQSQHGPLAASLVTGCLWGLWHLPVFFDPGSDKYLLGTGFIALFVLSGIGNAFMMTWLYNKTNGSLLLAGLVWHAAINFWFAVLLVSGFSILAAYRGEQVPAIAPQLYTLAQGLTAATGLAVAIATNGRLGLKADS